MLPRRPSCSSVITGWKNEDVDLTSQRPSVPQSPGRVLETTEEAHRNWGSVALVIRSREWPRVLTRFSTR